MAVALSQSFQRLLIPKWTWIVYVAISGSIYLWCVGGMLGALFIKTPPKTPFEVIDFASRVVANDEEHGFADVREELSIGREGTTRRKLQDKAILVSRDDLSDRDGEWTESERRWKIRLVAK